MTAPFDHLTRLIDTDHLKQGVKAIARQIKTDLADLPGEVEPVMVVVLKGGVVFGMDLLRALRRPMPVVFVPRSGDFNALITPDDQALLRGRPLIVVDTLMDSGNSLREIYRWLNTFQPLSIRLAVLLHKTVASVEDPLIVHYLGYEVPDVRLVGYGLDEESCFRGLPAVYTWWQNPAGLFSPDTADSSSDTPQKRKKRGRDDCPT